MKIRAEEKIIQISTEIDDIFKKHNCNVDEKLKILYYQKELIHLFYNQGLTEKLYRGRNDLCYCGSNKKYKHCCL